jgi:hypothetical protein
VVVEKNFSIIQAKAVIVHGFIEVLSMLDKVFAHWE